MLLQRYRAQVKDADMLADMVQDMRGKFCRSGPNVQIGASGGRDGGSLSLRTKAASDAAANGAEDQKAQ